MPQAFPEAGQSGRETISFAPVAAGATLELFLMAKGPQPAAVALHDADGVVGKAETRRSDRFERQRIVAAAPVDRLSYDPATTALSVVYAYDPASVLDTGIRILHGGPAATPEALRGYHFRPPYGWMNDPNGFGRFDGRAHLFYQHYPHRARWHAMHWGHAVSDDLLHWRHLPIFLEPDEAVWAAGGAGGVFSGTAITVPGEDGFRAFFTDHLDGREPEMEVQCTARSADGLTADAPQVVLAGRPEGLGLGEDNRDPYVFTGPDGRLKMLLGGRDATCGVVLLYETDDPSGVSGWRFVGLVHRELDYGRTVGECPAMLPLDGPAEDPATRWLLIVGLLMSRDPATRRRNLTFGIVGRFDGRTFAPEFRQELDFGADAYGFQAFVDRDGPVGIAWLANWTDIVKTADWPTAMTLPRRLLLRDGVLLTPPIEAVATLRQALIDDRRLAAGEMVTLEDGAAEIVIEFGETGLPFELALAHPTLKLAVIADAEGLAIVHESAEDGPPSPHYLAAGARVRSVRVFLDLGSIEVFADDGRHAGSKRLADPAPVTAIRLEAPRGRVTAARVWRLGL
ncbi:beta-fructofuranosidase [Pleomorphomonas carboxyditropha]|uniref:beta-fructofuranosidase n=1 Tax=Pleomorphomonas carboxyditropha TaxID=2023338 RepID=A0A2G9WSW9_9HYPH|nr:beta-fructofuranosidase [Pleomorphomonas carboxyditropha]PIO97811.1 beta-fructofuranosidase [Pleomorphomonas carboxyditropha]